MLCVDARLLCVGACISSVDARFDRVSAYFSYISARFRNQPRRPLWHNLVYRPLRNGIQYVEPADFIPTEYQVQCRAVGCNRTVRFSANLIRLIDAVNQTLARNRLPVQLAASRI